MSGTQRRSLRFLAGVVRRSGEADRAECLKSDIHKILCDANGLVCDTFRGHTQAAPAPLHVISMTAAREVNSVVEQVVSFIATEVARRVHHRLWPARGDGRRPLQQAHQQYEPSTVERMGGT